MKLEGVKNSSHMKSNSVTDTLSNVTVMWQSCEVVWQSCEVMWQSCDNHVSHVTIMWGHVTVMWQSCESCDNHVRSCDSHVTIMWGHVTVVWQSCESCDDWSNSWNIGREPCPVWPHYTQTTNPHKTVTILHNVFISFSEYIQIGKLKPWVCEGTFGSHLSWLTDRLQLDPCMLPW